MRHGSLFSGLGGFDYAATLAGWENIFHCEINPFCQSILKYYWPNAQLFTDIRNTDFTPYRGKIDILTGGFPCQPFSDAGKKRGTEDERHLWPEMLRAIRELTPRWVVGENVRGLLNWNGGMVFDQVQNDLELEGYEVIPFLLPAASINAPHQRYRIWFVAYRHGVGLETEGPEQQTTGLTRKGTQRIITDAYNYGLYGAKNRQSMESRNDHNQTRENQKGERHGVKLRDVVENGFLPTPTASDNPAKNTGKMNQDSLQKRAFLTTGKTSLLNPQFVAEMMGFPTDWTERPFLKV